MAINEFQLDCEDLDCSTGILGAAGDQDENCVKVIKESELKELIAAEQPYIDAALAASTSTPAQVFDNWPASGSSGLSATDFDIDNTNADGTKLKRFFGVGDIPDPEKTTIVIQNQKTHNLRTQRTINFTIYDFDNATRDWWRKVECGKIVPRILVGTTDSDLLGGKNMICPKDIDVRFPHDRGAEGVQRIEITITYLSPIAPDRVDNPL